MFSELDNGGIREAYRAYHKHLKTVGTEPQLPGLTNFSLDQVSVKIDFNLLKEYLTIVIKYWDWK